MSEVKIKAKYDQKIGKCFHYTIGKPLQVISGGLYFLEGTPVPEQITITFERRPEDE
jgi:hypothetical protein